MKNTDKEVENLHVILGKMGMRVEVVHGQVVPNITGWVEARALKT